MQMVFELALPTFTILKVLHPFLHLRLAFWNYFPS